MASQSVVANSRLAQMQMRFQKKQLEEREQRRVEMTGSVPRAEAAAAANGTVGQKNVGNGKVRQMFDERRRGAGIDRSNPLKPISSLSSSTVTTRTSKSTSTLHKATSRTSNGGATAVARKQPQTVVAARRPAALKSRDYNSNQQIGDQLDNGAISKQFSTISLTEGRLNGWGDGNYNNNNNINDNDKVRRGGSGAVSREQSSNSIKLNPVITKKSPNVGIRRPPTVSAGSLHRTPRAVVGAMEKTVSPAVKTTPKGYMDSMSMKNLVPPAEGMEACRFCGRNFVKERLAKHEHVCQKMMNSKRKVFDASKHRVQGTEAEKYLKKPGRNSISKNTSAFSATSTTSTGPKKNNWRKKHEEFIAAIRAAKEVQAHLSRGGKLSDLPPPPPSENPDYIQCPHCKRRFNEAAAERHIPRCANMLHNKPKPNSSAAAKKR